MKISEIITDKYKLRMPPTVYYDLLADVQEAEEEQEPTTKNCESCRYYGSHHEVCNYCYECSLWTEQEPTTKNDLGVDCISREQALVAIRNLYPGMPRVDFNGSLRKWVDKYKPYIECDDAIKELPSVTPQPRWIPVSERLPEQDKTGFSNWHSVKVFAQIKSNINDVWETEIVKGYFIEFDNEMAFSLEEFPLCIPDGWDFITLDKDNRAYDEEYSERYVELQAWMPLPAPFEPQESEEKE